MNKEFPFLSRDRIQLAVKVDSKKRIIELLSHLLSKNNPNLEQEIVYSALLNRERLGTTAIGHGIALPHARIPQLVAPTAALIRLSSPLPFEAVDEQAVDLFYALVIPFSPQHQANAQEDYLNCIAEIAAAFKEVSFRQQLRQAKTAQALYQSMLSIFEEHPYE